MIWIIFATMVGAAALIALWPLAQTTRRGSAGADLTAYNAAVAAADADLTRGNLTQDEAVAARNRAARLLLQNGVPSAKATAQASADTRKKIISVIVLLVFPAVSYALYENLGNSDAAKPQEQIAAGEPQIDFEAAVKKIELHLREHPEDGAGFEILAPVYIRMGRYDDAAKAIQSAIKLLGSSPSRQADYAEALIMANDGAFPDEAQRALNASVAASPNQPKANFYLGMLALQKGDKPKALSIWNSLLKNAPADAPWRSAVERQIAAASNEPAGQQPPLQVGGSDATNAMIKSMVAGLAAKLEKDPNQLEGWLRIIRSYVVLGQSDDAKTALSKARIQFASDAAALSQIEQLATSLGLAP